MMKYFNFVVSLTASPWIFGLVVAELTKSTFLGWVAGLLGLAYGIHFVLTVKKDKKS